MRRSCLVGKVTEVLPNISFPMDKKKVKIWINLFVDADAIKLDEVREFWSKHKKHEIEVLLRVKK